MPQLGTTNIWEEVAQTKLYREDALQTAWVPHSPATTGESAWVAIEQPMTFCKLAALTHTAMNSCQPVSATASLVQ